MKTLLPLPDSGVSLVALPGLDLRDRRVMTAPPGSTIADMVQLALPGALLPHHKAIRVTICDHVIEPAHWHLVRPRPGTSVVVRVVPADGNLRNALAAVVVVAAIVAGQYYLGPALAGTLGFGAGTLGASVVTSATSLALVSAASLLFKALVPAKQDSSADTGGNFAIQGFQNAFSPNGVIPCILGEHRYAPPYGMLPYTEADNDSNQYIVAMFCFGYGPLELDNLRFGETSIDNFPDVEVEILYGEISDGQLTLFSVTAAAAVADPGNVGNGAINDVDTDDGAVVGDYEVVFTSNTTFNVYLPSAALEGAGSVGPTYRGSISFTAVAGGVAWDTGDTFTVTTSYRREQVIEESLTVKPVGPKQGEPVDTATPQIRTTPRDITAVGVELLFPAGLYGGAHSVQLTVRYRLVGAVPWTSVDFGSKTTGGAWSSPAPGAITVDASTRLALRVPLRWTLPTRGQYEIEITRVTADHSGSTTVIDEFVLSALRGYRPEYPIQTDILLCLVAIRAKATGQLNGMIDNFNADASRVCLDWDLATATWIERATRNPASLYRYILQGPANPRPRTDDQVDLETLQDWHDFNVTNGLHYDRPHDFQASLWETLTDVARAGRATPRDDGVRWSVVIDKPQTRVIGHLTPRNSWGFSGDRTYTTFPDAFRVSFSDRTNGYQTSERIINWPGFVGDPDVTETIQMPGKTDPDEVWLEARRRQYELIYRLDRYTINQDIEALVLARGDLCALSHDALDRTQLAARVKSVSGNQIELDTKVTLETGEIYGLRCRYANGESILKSVLNPPGEYLVLTVSAPGSMPADGDLVMFGRRHSETSDVIVQSIEVGDNLTARITLLDYAPLIDELLAEDTPPAWSRAAG